MRTSHSRHSLLAAGAAALLVTSLAGCRFGRHSAEVPAPAAKPRAVAAQPLPLDLTKYQPNEAGEVPILEYHDIVTTNKVGGYQYPAAEFRKDLEYLYAHNYRPISLSDYVHGKIDVPAGLSPVILTFDDALKGQFNYTADGKIDPNCAVGIMDAFHAQHPDWPLKGTFFVLTDEDPKLPKPFTSPRHKGDPNQDPYAQGKMEYLVKEGFEIGNHTVHHRLGMRHMSAAQVQAEFAGAVAGIHKYLPDYNVQTLALPYGVYPKDQKLVISGQSGGNRYHNICAMLAGYRPSSSPMATRFNPYRLQRIIPGDEHTHPGGLNTIRYWLAQMEKDKTMKFVSDGDSNTYTVNAIAKGELNVARLQKSGFHLRPYNGTQLVEDTPKPAQVVAHK